MERPVLPGLSCRAGRAEWEEGRSLGECVSFVFDDAQAVHRSAKPMKRDQVADIPGFRIGRQRLFCQ